jgi:predicted O-methyltransferase YrrM
MMKKKYPKGILLDIGCGTRKQNNFVGIDWRKNPGVDIVHNLEKFPYPIDDESCLTIKCAHVIEHIKPWLVFPFLDEMWRMLIPNGQLAISAPYAGSPGFFQDPSHCTAITEKTWQHFDPGFPLYEKYTPKPWKIEHSVYKPDANIEAILKKVITTDVSVEYKLAKEAIERGACQKGSEMMFFFRSLKGKKLKTVVEIGTAFGGMFYALCQLAGVDATVVSIDLPEGEFACGQPENPIEYLSKFGRPKQRLHFLRADSHLVTTKKELLGILGESKVDLLFIDGDHRYKGVKKDWEMYSPLVKEGGVVAFHDIRHHHPDVKDDKGQPIVCEVEILWKELKKKHKTLEYIEQGGQAWGGIGVVIK